MDGSTAPDDFQWAAAGVTAFHVAQVVDFPQSNWIRILR